MFCKARYFAPPAGKQFCKPAYAVCYPKTSISHPLYQFWPNLSCFKTNDHEKITNLSHHMSFVTAQAENERLVNSIHLTIVETDVRDHK